MSGLQRRRARRRQPVVQLDPRARPCDRPPALALPVHAARSARLGFGPDRRRRRHRFQGHATQSSCCRPTAMASSTCSIAESGRLLLAKPFVENLNWATGVDADGGRSASRAWNRRGGAPVCPSVVGATNWMSPAFNPETGLYYVMALERAAIFRSPITLVRAGRVVLRRQHAQCARRDGSARCCAPSTSRPGASRGRCASGRRRRLLGRRAFDATGLVFVAKTTGRSRGGRADGRSQWQLRRNAVWRGSPMTYAVAGVQFIAIAAGGSIFAFGL